MCTERYVNPFTDFGFKLLFGTPANKEFLIGFLNAIIDCPNQIVDISYNNTEVFGPTPDERKAVYDLYCETSDGSHIIVEMQNAYQRYFLDRTIFYSSFPIQAATKRGEWDFRLPRIYTIAFLNFGMSEYVDDPAYKHVVQLMDTHTHRVFFDKLTYIYLEMPKFNKEVDDLHGYTDCWMYIMKNLALLDEKPERFRDKVFERFFRVAEIARFNNEQRIAYKTSLKIMRDYNNTIHSAEEKGVERGIALGREEGREEGRLKEKNEIARKLLQLGLPDTQICESTGLTESELQQLR